MRSSDEDARSLPFVPSVCKPKMRHEQLLFEKMKTTLDVRDRTHLVVDFLYSHESLSLCVPWESTKLLDWFSWDATVLIEACCECEKTFKKILYTYLWYTWWRLHRFILQVWIRSTSFRCSCRREVVHKHIITKSCRTPLFKRFSENCFWDRSSLVHLEIARFVKSIFDVVKMK